MKERKLFSYENRQERYFMIGKSPNYLCLWCGKSGDVGVCCGKSICIGFKARAPKKNASRKQWRRFCQLFKIDFTKLKFLHSNCIQNEA